MALFVFDSFQVELEGVGRVGKRTRCFLDLKNNLWVAISHCPLCVPIDDKVRLGRRLVSVRVQEHPKSILRSGKKNSVNYTA